MTEELLKELITVTKKNNELLTKQLFAQREISERIKISSFILENIHSALTDGNETIIESVKAVEEWTKVTAEIIYDHIDKK